LVQSLAVAVIEAWETKFSIAMDDATSNSDFDQRVDPDRKNVPPTATHVTWNTQENQDGLLEEGERRTKNPVTFNNKERIQNQAVNQTIHAQVNFLNNTNPNRHNFVNSNGKLS
jgi:hypothetical protein